MKKLRWTVLLAVPMLLISGVASAVVTAQLSFAIDGSGSVSGSDFIVQRTGLANAFGAVLATDGSVEVSVIQFASSAQVEVPATVVTAGNIASIIATINAISKLGGGTNAGAAVNAMAGQITGSGNFGAGVRSIMNLSTDGIISTSSTITAANAAQAAGIDALTAEGIGNGANNNNLKRVVYNNVTTVDDGSAVILAENASPPDPLGGGAAWVVPVKTFAAFEDVLKGKIVSSGGGGGGTQLAEPGTLALMLIGLLGGILVSRRRRSDGPVACVAA